MYRTEWSKNNLLRRIQSILLVASLSALLGLAGWLLGGAALSWMAAVFVLLVYLYTPTLSPYRVLKRLGGRRISYHQAVRLHRVVEGLARRAGLSRLPEIFTFPGRGMSAFTTGGQDNAVIAISESMLRTLSPREIAAVLAHEVSHIRNNDTAVMGFARSMADVAGGLSAIGQALFIVNLPLAVLGKPLLSLSALVLLILIPGIGALIQLALSRTREFAADLGAAELTGDPEALASALHKLERQGRGFWGIFLGGPFRPAESSLLRTHPPTAERIRRLREIGGGSRAPETVIRPSTLPGIPADVAVFPWGVRRTRPGGLVLQRVRGGRLTAF
jgi:heat shock protein HtpX